MPKFKPFLRPALIGALGALSIALPAMAQDILVHDAYARASGKNAKSGAIFLQIDNTGTTDDRLIAAKTNVSMKAELHSHTEDANGVMLMREVEGGIALASHETHMLARGGDHVMLMGITTPLAQGDHITLTLTFEKAGDLVVEVPVDNDR